MRQAADELRRELAGELVTFVVNRNINVSNVCTVGCAFCGFGQGRRSPDAYEHSEAEFRRRVLEAVEFGASEICMQSGIHPDWTIADYEGWLRLPRAPPRTPALTCTCTPTRRWRSTRWPAGCPLDEVFGRLLDAGLGSTPGTAAEVLHDGVRERISPNKLPVARWVEIIEAAHAAGVRTTVTVMFGHIEEPWELAEHMRVVRELQERTGGFTEFVPLSFIPFHTLLGRTHGIEEISREENLKHGGVQTGARPDDPEPAGELGEDGARRRHRGTRLGRERPRRHADGGVDQPPRGLPARRPARAGRPDRGRAPGRPAGGGARHALRHPAPTRAAGARPRSGVASRPVRHAVTPISHDLHVRDPRARRCPGWALANRARGRVGDAAARARAGWGKRPRGRGAGWRRRELIGAGLGGVAAVALGAAFWDELFGTAESRPLRPGSGYGPLGPPDELGFRLPREFRSRLVARGGEPVADTGYRWHPASDGMATFPQQNGGFVLVSNSEASRVGRRRSARS